MGNNNHSLSAGSPVFLQKINATNESPFLATGHCLRGYLLKRIKIGSPIIVLRTFQNGRQKRGVFRSSAVTHVECDLVRTSNSLWLLLPLTAPLNLGDLLTARMRGGSPVQCLLCGSIIRSPRKVVRVMCRCGLVAAPLGRSVRPDFPPWVEDDVDRFVDPQKFAPFHEINSSGKENTNEP